MASVARITDIRGLVSLNDGEEILKEKDPISENGGILTISDFARIIFDDGSILPHNFKTIFWKFLFS